MATEVTMPKLGLTMVEGQIVEWKKKEGESVVKGEILFVIETEKAIVEIEAPTSGILGKILVPEGETRPIGEVLAYILQPGETLSEIFVKARDEKRVVAPLDQTIVNAVSTTTQRVEGVVTTEASRGKVKISPVARKMAEGHNVDISKVKGTGPEGRIVKEDILRVIGEAKSKKVQPETVTSLSPLMAEPQVEDKSFVGDIIPMSQTRKVIARRTLESIKAPQGTLTREVDLSEALRFRKSIMTQFEKHYGVRLALTPIFVKAVALAVKEVPIMNSRIEGDRVYISHKVHVGIVVAIKDGIIIPVVFNAQAKSLAQIAMEWENLSKKASEGSLKLDQITGSTITISNVGNLGIDAFTPILNPPEVAILGITRTRQRPVVKDGQIRIGETAYLCLTGDHRVMDAEPIGQFLMSLERILQNPSTMLL